MRDMKYIVFDLDETLGYFTELSIIWGCLQSTYNLSGQVAFDKLCHIFDKEYFRPGIFQALSYLYRHRSMIKVILYTNNTGELSWLKLILSYMEKRAKAPGLFSKIVPGYRADQHGKYIRNSFEKSYNEILRCADIPSHTKLIFFDDRAHLKMRHPKVTYIQVKPYLHPLHPEQIILKLKQSTLKQQSDYKADVYLYKCITNFHRQYASHKYKYGGTITSHDDIIKHLQYFLQGTKKTVKHKRDTIVDTRKTRNKRNN
jgi:hypothetical protein